LKNISAHSQCDWESSSLTAKLTTTDLENHSDYSAGAIALSAEGAAITGAGIGYESGSQTSLTRSAISQGTITITDEAKQLELTGKTAEETIANINTDTANAHTALEKLPDLKALLADQQAMAEAMETVTTTGTQVVQDVKDGKNVMGNATKVVGGNTINVVALAGNIITGNMDVDNAIASFQDPYKMAEAIKANPDLGATLDAFSKGQFDNLPKTKEGLQALADATLKQLNHRYTLYFNKKYNRIGTLWQGRFKSWYVHDDHYLQTLIKYIEYNPIKAEITSVVGEYEWASSVSKEAPFVSEDDQIVQQYQNDKVSMKDNVIVKHRSRPLESYFADNERNSAIIKALSDGYRQTQIASHCTLSDVAVSKIVKIETEKRKLFEKLKAKGIFWSYSDQVSFLEVNTETMIEHVLKYADYDDIVELFKLYGKRAIFRVWGKVLKNDLRFKKQIQSFFEKRI
jgi:hypothetical protein